MLRKKGRIILHSERIEELDLHKLIKPFIPWSFIHDKKVIIKNNSWFSKYIT